MSEEKQTMISRRGLLKGAGIVAGVVAGGGIGTATLLSGCSVNNDPKNEGTSTAPPPPAQWVMAKRVVTWTHDPKICIGCGDCTYLCPMGTLKLKGTDPKSEQVEPENCVGCGLCMKECQVQAIDVEVYW